MSQALRPSDLPEAIAALSRADPVLIPALRAPFPLSLRPPGFDTLRNLIVSQMISTRAARAISGRMDAAGLRGAGAVAAAPEGALRRAGLSAAKARALRAIAQSGFDFAALEALPDAAAMARLVALPGVGRWTAECYLIFALARADAFAPGDLALAEALRHLEARPTRPRPADLAARARIWSPWRAVAARALWAYDGRIRGSLGEPP